MKNLNTITKTTLKALVLLFVTTSFAFNTPNQSLMSAVLNNDIEAVKQHIENGTDLNQKDPMSGATPLITAASFNKPEIVKLLIDAGADLEVKSGDGGTALHSSTFFCNVEITKMLLDAKADKTVRNNFGATPLDGVTAPFAQLKSIYEMLQQQLAPLGLKVDLDHIEKTRPQIAAMLK